MTPVYGLADRVAVVRTDQAQGSDVTTQRSAWAVTDAVACRRVVRWLRWIGKVLDAVATVGRGSRLPRAATVSPIERWPLWRTPARKNVSRRSCAVRTPGGLHDASRGDFTRVPSGTRRSGRIRRGRTDPRWNRSRGDNRPCRGARCGQSPLTRSSIWPAAGSEQRVWRCDRVRRSRRWRRQSSLILRTRGPRATEGSNHWSGCSRRLRIQCRLTPMRREHECKRRRQGRGFRR